MTDEQKQMIARNIAEKAKFKYDTKYISEHTPPWYNLCGAVINQAFVDLVNIYFAYTPTGNCKGVDLSEKASLIHFFHSPDFEYYARQTGVELTGSEMVLCAKRAAKKFEKEVLQKINKEIKKQEERATST